MSCVYTVVELSDASGYESRRALFVGERVDTDLRLRMGAHAAVEVEDLTDALGILMMQTARREPPPVRVRPSLPLSVLLDRLPAHTR